MRLAASSLAHLWRAVRLLLRESCLWELGASGFLRAEAPEQDASVFEWRATDPRLALRDALATQLQLIARTFRPLLEYVIFLSLQNVHCIRIELSLI